MNNLESIDYVNKDWVDDNDVCISRKSTEYPRLNLDYKTFFSPNKPWGETDDPIQIDF